MLIDLERNDLGRVCEAGSVHVDEFMTIESYSHVHHIVSNVRGRLRADVTPGNVLGGGVSGRHDYRLPEGPLHGDHRGAGRRRARRVHRVARLSESRRQHGHEHPDPLAAARRSRADAARRRRHRRRLDPRAGARRDAREGARRAASTWVSKHDGCCSHQRHHARPIRCTRSRSRIAAFSTATACSRARCWRRAACGFSMQHLRRLALGCERLGIAAAGRAQCCASDVQRLSGSCGARGAQDRRHARHRPAQLSAVAAQPDDARRRALSGAAAAARPRARAALVRDAARAQRAAGGHQASQSPRTGARAGGVAGRRRSSMA